MGDAFTDPRMSYALKTLAKLRKNRGNLAAGDERTVRLVALFPELLDRTPYEVICEYAAGETSWNDVVAELSDWPFTFAEDAQPGNPLSERTIGSWDDVSMAQHQGLISTAQYWQLYFRICEPQDNNGSYYAQ